MLAPQPVHINKPGGTLSMHFYRKPTSFIEDLQGVYGPLRFLFFKHNFLINLLGGSIGILISIAIVSVQNYFSVFTIPGIDSPYPVSLVFSNIILVFITLIIVGLFSGYVSSLILKKLR